MNQHSPPNRGSQAPELSTTSAFRSVWCTPAAPRLMGTFRLTARTRP
jgi:hypothetical protein